MPENRTIYVDMDDVLCETCRGFIDLLHAEFDRDTAFEDVTVFDLSVSFGMSRDEVEIFMTRAHEPEILAGFRPMPGARETLRAWTDDGYQVAIMTGRPPTTRVSTEDWLARHDFVYHSLDFVDKYGRHEVDSSFDEALTLTDLASQRFCLAVEDSAATAKFLARNDVAPVALIDRPWNRSDMSAAIRRMSGWCEVAQVYPRP